MRTLRHFTLVCSLSVVFGSSVTLGQVVCTGVPAWDAFALYLAANHDRVVSDGRLFEAIVDSRNARPAPGGTTWWRDLGACGVTGPAGVRIVGSWLAGTTHAVESGSNRALIFTAHVEHAGASISLNSVTYGGRPMNKVIERSATSTGTIAYTAAFILNESGISSASNGSFAPVWSTTPGQPPAFSSVFLVNVNQAAPVGASATMAATSATAATASLSTTSGDLVIVAATAGNSGSFTLNNGFTEALELAPGSADGVAGSKSATGAAEIPSVTHSNVNRQSVIGFVVRGGTGGGNNPPVFTSNPIVKPSATVNQSYSSSIAGDATDPNNDPLTFSRVSGPSWLIVSTNGALSGTPPSANSGLNAFTVSVADNRGGSATASLNITVQGANPTPTPTPDPNCNLPRRAIIGYWQNFSNASTFFRLGQVSSNFDVLNVSFALPTSNTDMRMQFVPESRLYSSNQDFINDVNLLHGSGKKVVISIGGATGAIDLTTNQQRTDFTNSMIDMIRTFNLDGMDIDFEGSAFLRNPGDNNFQSPTTPRIVNAIRAIRDIRNAFPGRCFILSFAPETFSLQAGFDSYDSAGFTTRGGYIPVIHALRDITTFVMTQDYNTGSVFGLDNNIYENGAASSDSQRSDFHVAMSEMLLRGFPVNRDPNRFFPALREDQVAIGLPAAPQAAGSGFTPVIPVQNAVRYLVQRVSYPGRLYTLQKPTGAYPNFRGLMTWSVNWDAANGFDFSTRHRSFLSGLP